MYLSLLVCSFVEMAPALLLGSPYCHLYLLSEKFNQDSLCLISWFSVTYFCNEFSFFVGKYFFGVRRSDINIGMITSLLGRQTISSVDSRYWRVLNKSSLGFGLEVDKFKNSDPRFDFRSNSIENSKLLVSFWRLF